MIKNNEAIIFPLIRSIITLCKVLLRGIGIVIIWIDDIKDGAIKEFKFVRNANCSSVDSLLTTKESKKSYDAFKNTILDA